MVQTLQSNAPFSFTIRVKSTIVLPVSTISSTIITCLPSILPVMPMTCLTFPVLSVPQYEDNFMETSWQSNDSLFISSAVNIIEPFKMQSRTTGSLESLKSAFMWSATLSMAFSSSSLGMKGLKVLSNKVILLMLLFIQGHKITIKIPTKKNISYIAA